MSRGRIVVILIALVASVAGTASAQDTLVKAKALYDDAAYEDALRLLDQVAGANAIQEVHQYRAMCLIALGRVEAAERAIALVVAANPSYRPDPEDVAPRVVAMFAEMRSKLLPQMVMRVFSDGRALFQDGDRERANERFNEVLRLLADPSLSGDPELADLKIVAGGFVDLQRAQLAPAPSETSAPIEPAASISPGVSAPAAVEPRSPVITRPVAITQVLPEWRPPDAVTASRSYSGAVKVTIDENGRVTSAAMKRRVYPSYDRVVLEAARDWVYEPATLDGTAIDSELTVEIRLEPRN